MGESSLGHVSTDVNGTVRSWGPGGMYAGPAADYYGKNSFRDGLGLLIPLTPDQEKKLERCLSKDHGNYSPVGNNCGSPVQDCLKELGIDTGDQTLPVNLGDKLLDLGVTNGIVPHPQTSPASGISAPWAK